LLQPATAVKPSAPVIVADPDFGAAAGPGRRFVRLPGTAVGAEKVRPALKAYTGGEPRLLLGTAAREEAVKRLVGPQVLLLSTHGFFLEALPRSAPGTRGLEVIGAAALGAQQVPHPLLRCGLALVGANGSADATPKSAADDGILTGLEV